MRKFSFSCFVGLLVSGSLVVNAADAKRTLCDPATTADCPGEKCPCVPDEFSIVFDESSSSELTYETFVQDKAIAVTVYSDTKSDGVQGWSYGVAHDQNVLVCTSAILGKEVKNPPTDCSTDAGCLYSGGFDATSAVDIQTCTSANCADRVDGGGWISAVVLSLTENITLEKDKKSSIAKATYTLSKDAGCDPGTKIAISDKLAKKKSPPAAINLTVSGNAKIWQTAIDGVIKKTGAGCGGGPETICDDGIDNDGDTKADCADTDCAAFEKCGAENTDARCADSFDNDGDGQKDCADSDCANAAPCKVEVCDDGIDNDGDTKADCADTDCAAFEKCGAENTDARCADNFDNDGDGQKDCADADCAATTPCKPGDCTAADNALYFGANTSVATVDLADADNYVITGRNKDIILGFELGVKTTTAAGKTTWEFADTLGGTVAIECIFTDTAGASVTPEKGNKATSNKPTATNIERGSAIAAFADQRDFFAFDLNPAIPAGATGFYVGYVADTNPPEGGGNKIPATGKTSPCPTNELLKVTIGGGVEADFIRGDADGNKKINVSDPVWIIQGFVGNFQRKYPNCRDIYDADDNGKEELTDAIYMLNYIFKKGPVLKAPFPTCGKDGTTTDALTCAAPTNCP